MRFFVIKKPAFLTFNMEKYSEAMPLMSKHQILSDGNKTNAALVKREDGVWCIKYGNTILEMKSVECKDVVVSRVTGRDGVFLEKTNQKWFVQNTANL